MLWNNKLTKKTMFKNNPIFFKDLLIALNSKQWKIVIFFFIVIYFLAFLLFLSEIKYNYNFFETSNIWKNLFQTVWIAQLITLTWLSFFRWLQSFTAEKANKTLDFIKISPISSTKFVLWKFLASISFILLLFIISLPFLSISLVLWWANLSDILIYSLFTVSYTSFAVLLWMMISSFSKNSIFSILLWMISVPLLIFFIVYFLWYLTDYLWFHMFNGDSLNIFFAIFPISIFEYISEKDKIIDFFWLKIWYLFFHPIIFWILNYFLFDYIRNQYSKYSNKILQSFNYFSTILLIILFWIFSSVFKEAIFSLVFSGFLFIYLFYIFNNNLCRDVLLIHLKKGEFKKDVFAKHLYNNYIYFLSTFVFITIILLISHWFIYHSIIILFLIFLLLFTLKDFLQIFFNKIWTWIFNTIYLLILILFFYIAPLIFTNLLNIEFKTINSVVKTALYQDNAQKFTCIYMVENNFKLNILGKNIENKEEINKYKNNEYSWTSRKCKWIDKNWITFYYLLYLILNIIFITAVVVSWKKKKD